MVRRQASVSMADEQLVWATILSYIGWYQELPLYQAVVALPDSWIERWKRFEV